MKHLVLFFTFVFAFASLRSQHNFNCTSHIRYQQLFENNAAFRNKTEQLENETKAFTNNQGGNKAAAASYIIPTVFHVIHTGGNGNINDAQIVDQIDILNKEFNRQQADTALTPLPFKALAAPFNVEFRLATIDPNGNCTNGINRIYSSLSNCSLFEDDIKGLSYWPSNKYLNVWIVQAMHYAGNSDCSGGGYATFPGGVDTLDGINIRGDLISNIGTAANNGSWGNFKGRYLIHELGHWFNLRHIWGDAICGNDLVPDTPPHTGANSGCPNFPHNANSSCAGSGPSGEMFTNYMDYTNGPCLNMFSAGQVSRMNAAMNSVTTSRHFLYTQSNLNATGTNNPYTYPPPCVATPDIGPYGPLVVCLDDSLRIVDRSYGGFSSSRVWNFQGGAAAGTNDSVVKVKFNAPGVYSFTLTNNYQGNSKSKVFANKINVLNSAADPNFVVPFVDDLENQSAFNSGWYVLNRDNDAVKWTHRSETSYSGQYCMGLSNYGNGSPKIDEIISPAYDLSNVITPTLTFRMHYTNTSTSNSDKLQVFISRNCGASWTNIYTSGATGLNTMGINNTLPYTPAVGSDDEWRFEKANIQPFLAKGVVRFKFTFTSGGGNNIFIDDINVDGINTTDIKNYSNTKNISVYPNPANDYLQLNFYGTSREAMEIKIIDVAGRTCSTQNLNAAYNISAPEKINTKNLNDGIYFIEVKQGPLLVYKTKFIKQHID